MGCSKHLEWDGIVEDVWSVGSYDLVVKVDGAVSTDGIGLLSPDLEERELTHDARERDDEVNAIFVILEEVAIENFDAVSQEWAMGSQSSLDVMPVRAPPDGRRLVRVAILVIASDPVRARERCR